MFHRITFGLLFVFYLQPASSQPQFQTFVQDYLKSFPDHSEIAIGIIDGDDSYQMGYRVEGDKVVSIDNASTLFEIGSITKVFTAALLMNEVKKRTMDLNDPLQKHLPVPIKRDTYQNQPLTMLHLITHTSGLKKNPLTSYKRYASYMQNFELTYLPGKAWDYNNMAVGLVGELAAQKNSVTWDVLLKDNILKPLGMTRTFANLPETPEVNRVQCVSKSGAKKDCYFHNVKSFQWPNGGMISNVEDMMKWLKANLASDSARPELSFIQDAHDPLADSIAIPWFVRYKPTQGIGWWHYRGASGNRVICHGGNMPAQTSFIAFDKTKRRGIIILTNVSSDAIVMNDRTPEMSIRTMDLSMQVLGM